jgi:hypothetical protein
VLLFLVCMGRGRRCFLSVNTACITICSVKSVIRRGSAISRRVLELVCLGVGELQSILAILRVHSSRGDIPRTQNLLVKLESKDGTKDP